MNHECYWNIFLFIRVETWLIYLSWNLIDIFELKLDDLFELKLDDLFELID